MSNGQLVWVLLCVAGLLLLTWPWPLEIVLRIVEGLQKRLGIKLLPRWASSSLNAKVEMGATPNRAITVESGGIACTTYVPKDLSGFYLLSWLNERGEPQVRVVPLMVVFGQNSDIPAAFAGRTDAGTYVLTTDDELFTDHAVANTADKRPLSRHDVDSLVKKAASQGKEPPTP